MRVVIKAASLLTLGLMLQGNLQGQTQNTANGHYYELSDTAYYINDHFDGDSLSNIWIQTAGVPSDYTVSNSSWTITNTLGGVNVGLWQIVRFRAAFFTTEGFYISSAFSYGRSYLKLFDICLINNHEDTVTAFRLWDSPTHWILASKKWGDYDCNLEMCTAYEPHDIEIYRSAGIMSIKWDGTIQWQCPIADTISWLELSFGACSGGGGLTPISIDSIYCNSYPLSIDTLAIGSERDPQHVMEHQPTIMWQYNCYQGGPQQGFQINVGTNNDWLSSEMWDPSPFQSSDTFIVYGGVPLLDGQIYYARLRIQNALAWSDWYETSFRMNSLPDIPGLSSPCGSGVVGMLEPPLYVHKSADAEGDTITYYFEVYDDSLAGAPIASGTAEEQADSTGWTVNVSLDDNNQYFWRARAFDGYEYSPWSGFESFWVDSIEQYPTAFDLYFPPDTGWSPVYDFPILFRWGASDDPDPLDSVRYKLMIAVDSNFTFAASYDTIYQTTYPLPSLNYGIHYWWKVYAIDTKGSTTHSNGVADFMTWVLGDANCDLSANVGDAVYLIGYIFKNGPAPYPLKTGDANGDCEVNVGDVVYLINYIFRSGEPPRVGCAPPAITPEK